MTSTRKISDEILAVMIAATLLTPAIIIMSSNIQSIFAQQPQPQPVQPPHQLQQPKPQQQALLNFYLKLANNASTAQAASQAAANGTGTKNMTITVMYRKALEDNKYRYQYRPWFRLIFSPKICNSVHL